MSLDRELFYKHVAQTTEGPIGLEIAKASGVYMFTPEGKKYIDLISGVTVSNIGHCHPEVVKAIQNQSEQYMHLMVYGEYIQAPQVQYAETLIKCLPESLNNVYFVNSGSEAVEGAIKLAKRHTHRSEVISMKNSYHGSTHACLSLMGNEDFRFAFRPLLPDVRSIRFGVMEDLELISTRSACVILDPLQCENGLVKAPQEYFYSLRKRCSETGCMLIFDEVQTGFGRTGSLFYLEKTVVPDILVLAKAMGGGMPLGGFVANENIMKDFTHNPALGHITTFGGHPVSCAAGLAAFNVLTRDKLHEDAHRKGQLYVEALKNHPQVKDIRQEGLFVAVDLDSEERYWKMLAKMLDYGLVTDSFLWKLYSFRIAPPLNITDEEIQESIRLLIRCLDEI